MAKRSSTPALYELINRGGPSRDSGSSAPEPAPDPVSRSAPEPRRSSRGPSVFEPGRVIRVPVGYVALCGVLVIMLVISAYVVGHSVGETGAKDQSTETMQYGGGQIQDPLAQDQPRLSPREPVRVGVQPGSAAAAAGMGPIESDPRRAGLRYFYLVTTDRDGALQVATFCRQNGLEAYVVRYNNLRRVVILPGFAAADRQSPEIRNLGERIKDVVRLWDTQVSKGKLETSYIEEFKG